MGVVKAPDVPQPKRGLTDFERKIADILFAETSTNELQVERVLDVAIAIGEGLMKDAVSRVVHIGDDSCPFLRRYELAYDIKTQVPDINEGDKVKVIIVKEN